MTLVRKQHVSPGDAAYRRAMEATGDLVERMRTSSASADPVRGLLASIWLQRHNIPFVTTVHEAVHEMRAPIEQKSGG